MTVTIEPIPISREDIAETRELARELRNLADMIQAHPELAANLRYAFNMICVPVTHDDDPAGSIARMRNAAHGCGAQVVAKHDGKFTGINITFGKHVDLSVYTETETPR